MAWQQMSEATETQKLSPQIRRAINAAATAAARKAAKQVAEEILLRIGMNVNSPEAALELQEDAAWVRRVREAAESRWNQYGLAAFGALLTFVGAVAVLVVQWAFASLGK